MVSILNQRTVRWHLAILAVAATALCMQAHAQTDKQTTPSKPKYGVNKPLGETYAAAKSVADDQTRIVLYRAPLTLSTSQSLHRPIPVSAAKSPVNSNKATSSPSPTPIACKASTTQPLLQLPASRTTPALMRLTQGERHACSATNARLSQTGIVRIAPLIKRCNEHPKIVLIPDGAKQTRYQKQRLQAVAQLVIFTLILFNSLKSIRNQTI